MCRDKTADKTADETFHEGLLAGIGAVRNAIDQFVEKQEKNREVQRVLAEVRAQAEPQYEPVPDHLPQPIDALIDDLRKAREEVESVIAGHRVPATVDVEAIERALDAIGHAEDRAGEVWHELKGTGDRVDQERGSEAWYDRAHDAF